MIVTAPVVFGRMHILPIVIKLLRAHPQLNVNLTLVDRVIRLVEEGIDVAVRIADLSDSSLHVVRLAEVRRVLVASPTYLADRGVPSSALELLKHNLIVFDNFATSGEWRFTKSGRPAIRCEPRLLTNSVEAAIDASYRCPTGEACGIRRKADTDSDGGGQQSDDCGQPVIAA